MLRQIFKHKNDAYRVPRREKFFRLMTVFALLVALAVLVRDMTPKPDVVGCTPDIIEKIEAGGEIVIECGGVIWLDKPLVIERDTSILGAGERITSISGNGSVNTLIQVKSGVTLKLEGPAYHRQHQQSNCC